MKSALMAVVALGTIALVGCAAAPSDEESETTVASSQALKGGLTVETLQNAGWTCFKPPSAPRIVCAVPGLGLPTPPANPESQPTYNFLAFDLTTHEYIGKAHMIRQDLYAGQPGAGGGPYVLRAPIGYYECFNPQGAD